MYRKVSILILILALAGGAAFLLLRQGPVTHDHTSAQVTRYHCPMHPDYITKEKGECPICGMDLVPIQADDSPVSSDGAPAGRVTIRITPEKQQLIGLRTEKAAKQELATTLRAAAVLEHDERRLARIAPRFSGFIRTLHVNTSGQSVSEGEPLLTVYSPDLFSAEREYLLAYERAASEAGGSAQQQLRSARRRLELWQISPEEIRELEQTRKAKDELLIRAPFSGHVVAKNAVEGMAFEAGQTLYEIADLSHLWARAWIYEYQLPLIKVGQLASLKLSGLNKSFTSTVTFIYPHIDPVSRRAEIRLELDNPDHELRPEMWATAEITLQKDSALAIPASAVIETGERNIAFVKAENHHLEPRAVALGVRTSDYYEVTEGIAEGEEVVTRALFLVDSESQLKAAIQGMIASEPHQH
jgi:Cu(I)/Ag(I) efflux system membrane fusion protein